MLNTNSKTQPSARYCDKYIKRL